MYRQGLQALNRREKQNIIERDVLFRMKRFLSVLLVLLLLVFPIKTQAETDLSLTPSDTSFEIVSENSDVSVASAAEGIVSGTIYNIKNVNSGKYLNVHNGVDANGTNVYQWTKDGSAEQKFKVIYSAATDSYKFYAMCSSSGNGRVVDILNHGNPLANGQNVNLWTEESAIAQQFVIIPLGQGQYRIACKYNTALYLTANGTSNGTSTGTHSSSAGNVYISGYVESMTQHWIFEAVGTASAAPPYGYADGITSSGVTGWVWRNDIPDSPIDVHVYVNNSQGQTVRVYTSIANIYRQDLYDRGFGNGAHGFSCPIDWKTYVPATYTVIVYAIGYNGYNPAILNTPATYTVSECAGVVDAVDSTNISGWLWKPSAPNATIDVHIYINRLNGENVGVEATTAGNYREDLLNAGYGNGYHGYWLDMDWSQYPEENLQVVLYAVDGSGYNPAFWVGTYNNCQTPINLAGVTDHDNVKFYTTFVDPMTTWCQNIGCSTTNIYNETNLVTTVDYIKQSYYCVLFTHGTQKTLEWKTNEGRSGLVDTDYIGNLSDGYFDKTKCVLLMACKAGQGGVGETNVVNAVYNKGADVVVGFQNSIWFSYYNTVGATNYKNMVLEHGAPAWCRKFTESLGAGKTISAAIYDAFVFSTATPGSGTDEEGNQIPADYGLGSVYVAGNASQTIKR